MDLNQLLILVGVIAVGIAIVLYKNRPKEIKIELIVYEEYFPKLIDYEILGLINVYRLENGLEELGMSSVGNDIAYSHVKWLSNQNIVTEKDFDEKGHYGVQGRFDQIILRYGSNTRCGENVAWNYRTALSYFTAWKASPGHNANMLGNYTHLGVSSNERFCETLFIKI